MYIQYGVQYISKTICKSGSYICTHSYVRIEEGKNKKEEKKRKKKP